MNIHEIITAWENNTLPKDLSSLAAIQNKVDDYQKKALAGLHQAANEKVRDMYHAEVQCYNEISGDLEKMVDEAIPELLNKN